MRGDTELEDIDLSTIDDDYLRSVKLSDFYRFISWLARERDNGPAARSRRISAVRSFFHYLTHKARVLDQNPAAELESPKISKRLPRYLDIEESKRLLETAVNSDSPFATRDYCILTLFLNCGMRLSELVGINLSDIKGDTLTVLGKGNKERTIYLNAICMEALDDYLKERLKPQKQYKDALFISRNRRRISQRAVQNVVRKYVIDAGLDPKKYTVHKLRHTAATLMYQYGQVDLRSLQQLLGHQSVATTEIYTHISDDMLHQAVAKNPLNTLRRRDLEITPEED